MVWFGVHVKVTHLLGCKPYAYKTNYIVDTHLLKLCNILLYCDTMEAVLNWTGLMDFSEMESSVLNLCHGISAKLTMKILVPETLGYTVASYCTMLFTMTFQL